MVTPRLLFFSEHQIFKLSFGAKRFILGQKLGKFPVVVRFIVHKIPQIRFSLAVFIFVPGPLSLNAISFFVDTLSVCTLVLLCCFLLKNPKGRKCWKTNDSRLTQFSQFAQPPCFCLPRGYRQNMPRTILENVFLIKCVELGRTRKRPFAYCSLELNYQPSKTTHLYVRLQFRNGLVFLKCLMSSMLNVEWAAKAFHFSFPFLFFFAPPPHAVRLRLLQLFCHSDARPGMFLGLSYFVWQTKFVIQRITDSCVLYWHWRHVLGFCSSFTPSSMNGRMPTQTF